VSGNTHGAPVVIGIDLGTGGARCVAVDATGSVAAEGRSELPPRAGRARGDRFEQDARDWWRVVVEALRAVTGRLGARAVRAVAVDSTSGTLLPVDRRGRPLRAGIMYNDARADAEAEELGRRGANLQARLGYRFSSSFSLAKALWLARNEPDVYEKTWKLLHPADYIAGVLAGSFETSDTSNVLKMGYDLLEMRWPDLIAEVGLDVEKLPRVARPGEKTGEVGPRAAGATGLDIGTAVVAGATDGTAAFFASGAARVGDFCSTLGTTLVVKGVSERLILDDLGRVYCHLHPAGWWLPGGASNVGGQCISLRFDGRDLDALSRAAARSVPTELVVYPLMRKGERFPFVSADAEGFVLGEPHDEAELFAGYLEGVGLVERWVFDLLDELGAAATGDVYTTGGGASNDLWMRLRAAILGRPVMRAAGDSSALGSAVLAAAWAFYGGDVVEASRRMAETSASFDPDPELAEAYSAKYEQFRCACEARGYR